MWEKDPDQYASTASNGAFVIMSRTFAPADVRLRALIARERLMPKLFVEGKANLKNPPKIYTKWRSNTARYDHVLSERCAAGV